MRVVVVQSGFGSILDEVSTVTR